MALITAATEENSPTHGFSEGATLTPLPLTPGMRLDHAVRALAGFAFGDTDCALPMLHALKHDLAVDAFVAYTDSDTRAGTIHPQATASSTAAGPALWRSSGWRHCVERLLHRRSE